MIGLVDWIIVALYVVFAIGIGIYFSKRASRNIKEYFISGRSLPWWIAGTSMVATTFAADTPLAITGFVARNGIAGNWLWWNMAISHVLAVFFFAKLWRRANIITDLELIELRYSGKPAAILRGFRSLWEGVFLNCIVMGWVMLAMTKIIVVLFGGVKLLPGLPIDEKWQYIIVCLIIAFIYSVLSGLWGVVMTDFIQFFIAMIGSIALAIIAAQHVGGMASILNKLYNLRGLGDEVLHFTPKIGSEMMPFVTFVSFISVFWWAGKFADAGGYMAQRMFSAKDEKHSVLSMLWFNITHYALRPWPWIVVGLVSLVVYPNLSDPEIGYPKMVVEFLPAGLKGLMIASFLAAFMSTIDTQVNWGSSYIINDFYKRFIKKQASEAHYVAASRWAVLIIMILGSIIAYIMQSIGGAWKFFYAMTMGIGGVYIARWFWWRVNAWSEITAWVSAALGYAILYFTVPKLIYGWQIIIVAGFSTVSWLFVTYITAPVDKARLIEFYKRVRPGSPWWKPIAQSVGDVGIPKLNWRDFANWFAGILLVYSMLFSIGKFIFGMNIEGFIYLMIAAISGGFIYRNLTSSARTSHVPVNEIAE